MALIEAHGTRRRGKSQRELHHLEIHAGKTNKSHVIEHHDTEGNVMESHEFQHPAEGEAALMHIAQHAGFEPSPGGTTDAEFQPGQPVGGGEPGATSADKNA